MPRKCSGTKRLLNQCYRREAPRPTRLFASLLSRYSCRKWSRTARLQEDFGRQVESGRDEVVAQFFEGCLAGPHLSRA
jgi:hypothetical protein